MAPTTASNPPPFSINGLRAKKKNELIGKVNVILNMSRRIWQATLHIENVIIIFTSTDIASSLGLDTSGFKNDLESRIK